MEITYSIIVYFRCAEEECVFNIQDNFYSTDLSQLALIDFFFDSDRADILWPNTQSYDEALAYYLTKLTNPCREIRADGLDEIWPIFESLYFRINDKDKITVEKFISIFEELAFVYSIPVCFPDLKSLSEVTEKEYKEKLQNYL